MKIKALIASLLLVSVTANAQFGGLSSLAGGKESNDQVENGVSAEESQEALVQTFVETLTLVMTAQQLLQGALGNSEEAASLQLSIDELSGDCPKECLDRTVQISSSASASIQEKIEAQESLEADKKELYIAAIPSYIQGTLKARDLATDTAEWSKQSLAEIKEAGVMGAGKMRSKLEIGTFVASNIPTLVKSWGESTSLVLSFAKSNDISLDSMEGVNDFAF